MLSVLRRYVRKNLPHRALAAYRTIRYASFAPFEPELLYIRRLLHKGAIAIDIGANVGLYTREMAKHAAWVVAFEPHPGCVHHLEGIAPRNATIVPYCLSNQRGVTTLSAPVTAGIEHHGLSRIGEGDGRSYSVAMTTLDLGLADAERPLLPVGFIKIDVEGHELAVLEGARETLTLYRPALLVEVEYRHSTRVGDTFALLSSLGYQALVLQKGALQPITPQALQWAQRGSTDYINNVFFLQ